MAYAWIIDKDHLAEEERKATGHAEDDAKNRTGPRDAPLWMLDILTGFARPSPLPARVFVFTMYDDDKVPYYAGRMITDDGGTVPEEACYGPLGDFGSPNAGCTEIKYRGHRDMDCG